MTGILETTAPTVVSILLAMAMAAMYSALFYLKKRLKTGESEDFNERKFIATVLVGAGVGAMLALGGVNVTDEAMYEALPQYVGMIALVEALLKSAYRAYEQRNK